MQCAASALKVEEGGEKILTKNKLFSLNIHQLSSNFFMTHGTGVPAE